MKIIIHAKRSHIVILAVMALAFIGAMAQAASITMNHSAGEIEVIIGQDTMTLREALDAKLIKAATVNTADTAKRALYAGDSPKLGGAPCASFKLPASANPFTYTCGGCVDDMQCSHWTQSTPCVGIWTSCERAMDCFQGH